MRASRSVDVTQTLHVIGYRINRLSCPQMSRCFFRFVALQGLNDGRAFNSKISEEDDTIKLHLERGHRFFDLYQDQPTTPSNPET